MNSSSEPHPWQRLAEYTLPSAAGSTHLAIEKMADAVQPLHLTEPLLTRLQTALAEAIGNSVAYRLRWQVQTSILLQVNVSVRALSDQPDQETPLSPPGWGFFVIERMTGIIDAANKTNQHVIELYLYQDSGEPQRN